MRKVPIFIANILIIFFIMVFVSLYVRQQGKIQSATNTENFVNMSIGLERVTTYYLEGEQRLCNSWARYIKGNKNHYKENNQDICYEYWNFSHYNSSMKDYPLQGEKFFLHCHNLNV